MRAGRYTRYASARFLALAVCAGALCARVAAQSQNGPQTPAKAPEVVRIPTTPGGATDTPPIPAEEIIRRFAEHEDQYAQANKGYVSSRLVRLDELGDDGKPVGYTEVTTTPVVTPEGVRIERPEGEPKSTLQFMTLERDDLELLDKIPQFPLVTAELPKYNVTYQGPQKVDELMTYVFTVTPKQLVRGNVYFSGLVWVDEDDLAIVETYGKWVNDAGDVRLGNLPFNIFETYRQPVGKYWFPAYSIADGSISVQNQRVGVRLIMRWDKYMPVAPNSETSPAH